MPSSYEKVLVIDDDPIQQEVLRAFLVREGVRDVLLAQDGLEAIEKLDASTEIDLIMLDLNMPERDGIELMDEFAARNLQTPIVIASGAMNPIFRAAVVFAEAKKLNLLGALTKPIDYARLAEMLTSRSDPH